MGNVVIALVQDPTRINSKGYPTTLFEVYMKVNGDMNSIHNAVDPVSAMNEAITDITTDREIGDSWWRGYATICWCAYCGGAMGLTECYRCHNKYKDDRGRAAWADFHMPNKVSDHLRSVGHRFLA
jgi:hypothetical protein